MSTKAVAVVKPQRVERADIVIIGNGIAGLTAAVEARRMAPDLSIAIVTDQIHPTINTPALKQFAIGKLTTEQLLAYPPGTERAQRIHLVNGRVDFINAQSKYITLENGIGFGYNSLLIATGSKPNGIPADLPGRHFDGVLRLHRLQDYLDFRRRLPEVEDAVVIGGGAHAIETVMGLLHLGIEVHWLIRGKTLLSNMLDQAASDMVLESVRDAGANVYTETQVLGIVGRIGSVVGVVTNTQQMLPCQMVLFCTGTGADTKLAERCDMPIKNKKGIVVDDQLRSSVRDIYAAGDVAAIHNPFTGKHETRAQWYAAVLQARTVAAAMTGRTDEIKPFGVPWHATHLGELSMLNVGSVFLNRPDVTTITEVGKRNYCRMALIGDRLVGYLSLSPTPPDSLSIKRIIDEGLSVRDIKKALLKGNFDSRRYFSEKQTYAAQALLTSGRLPAVEWAQNPNPPRTPMVISPDPRITIQRPTQSPIVPVRQNTPALPAQPAAYAAPQYQMMPPQQMPGGMYPGVPQQAIPVNQMPVSPVNTGPVPAQQGIPFNQMPVSPVNTGPVPAQQAAYYDQATIHSTDYMPPPLPQTIDALPTMHGIVEEEKNTGDIPGVLTNNTTGSMLKLPVRSVSGGLWSYTNNVPAVNKGSSSSRKGGR